MSKLKIGLVGSMQINFPGDKKKHFNRSITELVGLSKELGFDFYYYPELVISKHDAEKAKKAIEAQCVDFLLIQNTSFAAGSVITILAKTNAFIGLWSIPESNYGGQVPLNSFCGTNMFSSIISNYLKGYAIKYKWFFGFADNKLFIERFKITVKALTVIKKMKNSAVALIGGIAPGFDDLYFDERLGQKRFGLDIQRNHEYSELRNMAKSYKLSELDLFLELVTDGYKSCKEASKEDIELNARFYKAYIEFANKYNYDALAISCWPKFQDEFNSVSCSILGKLNQNGIPAACEGDLPGAVSMLLLKYLSEQPTTLMDLIAFDEKDESVLLWHCGPSAECFANEDGVCLKYYIQNTEDGKGNPQGMINDLVIKPGIATIMRITGEWDKIFLSDGKFLDNKKESYKGSRGWFYDLKLNRKKINVLDFINTILAQGFQHHYPIVFGDLTEELMEIAAWLDLKPIQTVKYENYLQNQTI